MSEIAGKIREIRNSFKLSQYRFGKKIGVSGKTVSAYETGRAVPPEKIIHEISEVFSTPIIYMNKMEKCKLRDQILSVKNFVDNLEKVLAEN
ncbi:hypothetical protein A2380_03370 [candidate division WWE3 bacterium RIFOXYB1_FULL_43_24]|uniref:Helix-turn-helix domain-containing protein n=2 Tax=Katanobacteria TaxID=422282 RepID=A0A0G1AT04_UNCKA|nr:MAG: Helix-turn-helix domain-containing protein [candidate division WWE3 bacterium GW2011_GWA1_42_12]KKS34012.1 MAG: Helix-turn-helix domain-containing protein [candidate division WWE3 bacterium GW2011_GWD1_42_14]KKS37201.1 MAG: Helix-turn-helix domain-containing protein [candidate division WWE3 bacterium GW2011_GWF1_42_14]KKS40062.1 MAG: Helix-turn-helix domain-containing protein [candidate division WWE3 bacterium GW2011_GWE1_42_16]KKS66746.1 MAG: Helix-turn-helix domain-containing protein 